MEKEEVLGLGSHRWIGTNVMAGASGLWIFETSAAWIVLMRRIASSMRDIIGHRFLVT